MRTAALFTLLFLVTAPGVYARGEPNILVIRDTAIAASKSRFFGR